MSVKVKDNGSQVHFFCPGCDSVHSIAPNSWAWNGDSENPTFDPSVLVHPHETLDKDHLKVVMTPRCHSFVRNGKIEFLSDSEHWLRGKTVDLPEWPYQDS